MNRFSKIKSQSKRFKYYILLSILIHIIVFLFADSKKEITLGENLIPIELLDIPSIASQGEYFQKPQDKNIIEVRENINNQSKIKKEQQREHKDQNTTQISKIIKGKKSIITTSASLYIKRSGSEGKLNSKEVEKGSIKGKGIEKITCLLCLKPNYPKLAIKRGYEGKLKIKILISKNGEVIDYELTKSSGYKILDQSGIDAAKKLKFHPLSKEITYNIIYDMILN